MMMKFTPLQVFTWIMLGIFLFPGSMMAETGPTELARKKHQALNEYIEFANECTHILTGVRKRLEDFNRESIQYLASNGASPLQFHIHDMIDNYQFHSTYQGPCLWVGNSRKAAVNIQYLYDETSLKSHHIPEKGRSSLNKIRNDIMFLMIEFLGMCDTLEEYTTSGRHLREPELKTAFWAFQRCEILYHTFGELHQNLYDQVNAIADPAPQELLEMRDMITHSREIIRAVKSENIPQLNLEIIKLKALIDKIERYHAPLEKDLKRLGLDLKDTKSGYENMVIHARSLLDAAEDYLMKPEYEPQYHIYGKGYFYFNHSLLDGFNHHKYGMLAYYNRFLSFANQPLVKMMEEPPVFQVIYKLEVNMPVMLTAGMGPSMVQPTRTLASRATRPLKASPTNRRPQKKDQPAKSTTPVTILQEEDVAEKTVSPSSIAEAKAETKKEFVVHTIQRQDKKDADISLKAEIPQEKVVVEKPLAGAAANHLIFVVDVSSSMEKPEKLPVMVDALIYLSKVMRPEDRITVIAYSGTASIHLEATSAADRERIVQELSKLRPKGKTQMRKGLKLAYQMANEHFIPQGNNRVILASDGMIRMNRRAKQMVKRMAWEDITLSIFHLTKGNSVQVQSNLMELAELGAGTYHHMNRANAQEVILEEARAVMRR